MESRDPPRGEGRQNDPQSPTTGKTEGRSADARPSSAAQPTLLGVTASQSGPVRGRTGASGIRRWARRLGILLLILVGVVLGQIVVYRFAMPPWTPTMLVSRLLGDPVDQQWVPLGRISPQLVRAVIASEDARFCVHYGIDFGELKAAIEDARGGSAPRGASTITMQVVKNVFLWPGRSYVRKALELPLALAVEVAWSKRRILEVYLNIAEWGPGTYGIEAASRQSFGKRASELGLNEAARLAVVLPNPVERDPGDLEPRTERVAEIIAGRARRSVNTACLD